MLSNSRLFVLQVEFLCSFGYETMKIKVTGQGGLPNCVSTRLDIPSYVERSIRAAHRTEVVSYPKALKEWPVSLHCFVLIVTSDC